MMRVRSQPASKAITGSKRIKPPIIPFTILRTVFVPERFSYSEDICLNYKSQDLINKKMKILIPNPIANNHEIYVKNYLF